MSRILFATVPVLGHVAPLLPLCRALVARGHDVAWYTGGAVQRRVVGAGARYFGYRRTFDYDASDIDGAFPERRSKTGIQQIAFDMKHAFIEPAAAQCEDLEDVLDVFPADVIVADPGMLGALLVKERRGLPVVGVGIAPLIFGSVDTGPFGLGLHPSSRALGRLRNRTLTWLVQSALFGEAQRHWNVVRARVGLSPTGWFMDSWRSADAYVQPSVPGFEYARSDLPKSVTFVGMMPAERPSDVSLPSWWSELDGSRPVVHVTQGTVANVSADLIGPALQGLASEDVLVVVSTGNRPLQDLKLASVPNNARIAPFLSYPDLLPKTSVMVTNGGYGGVQMALSYGVPVIAGGRTEDKPEVSARVSWAGAGLDLKASRPSPETVRRAVRQVLDDPRYRARARELAAEYARYDAVPRCCDLVERWARRHQARQTQQLEARVPHEGIMAD